MEDTYLNEDESFRAYCLELAVDSGAEGLDALEAAMAFNDFILDEPEEWDGHDSDCALHNEPAFPNGLCNCR